MKVPQYVIAAVLGAALAMAGWSLQRSVSHGERIAALEAIIKK